MDVYPILAGMVEHVASTQNPEAIHVHVTSCLLELSVNLVYCLLELKNPTCYC